MIKEDKFVLAPGSKPQEAFLKSSSTITLYSGSAGAGKTFAIILNMVKFALEKNSTIILFRRTSTEIRQGGGIWQETCTVFKKMFGKDVVIRNRDLEIYLPATNSIIKMAHLQYQGDVSSHLGGQYSVIFFDEAVLFDFQEMILPLIGRLRNANVSYKPQMFWATNPMYGHGIYNWIKDFYLDQEGVPLKERSNVERYFVLQNGEPIWFDSLEEAESIYGKGDDNGVLSFRSIRAHVTDNKKLLEANPGYISNLKGMSPIKQRIYLDGSWTAREEEAGLYLRSFSKVVPYPNLKATKRVRAYDLASQPVSSQSPNPDWSRGVLMSKDADGIYTVEDLVSARDRPHVIEKLILDTARKDKEIFGNVVVAYPCDPGQSGIARAADMKRMLAEVGVECKIIRPQKSKRVRFLPASAIAEAGYLNVVKADWNEEFYKELEEFTGLKRHERDDIVDCVSDAVLCLNQTTVLPTFTLPDLSGPSNTFSVQVPSSGLSLPHSGLSLPRH